MVRVCHISDTHMTHLELKMPDADLLIHTGDGLDWGEEQELIRLNNWFGTLKQYKKILYIPGNHDIIIEEDTEYARELMTNATILIDEPYEFEGKKIWGTPYCNRYGDWAFMKPDLNLQVHWDKIPLELDVLATHSPPYGILDRNYRGDLCGSQTLMKAVLDKQPRTHVFGHIHESGNQKYVIEPTTFYNSAIVINWFDTREKNPTVFDV